VRRIRPHLSPLAIHYVVANVGETRALIKQHEITLFVDPSGELREATQTPVPMECRELAPGESVVFGSRGLADTPNAEFDYAWSQATDNGTLMIRGLIEYEDERGILRRTGFFRTYDARVGLNRASDDPEEEYED
jgi:hypothetical protein